MTRRYVHAPESTLPGAFYGCWTDDQARTTEGYGVTRQGGVLRYKHRLAYEALVAEIPAGLTIDHLCKNRGCYNPAHMEPVTRAENLRRAVRA